MSHNVSMNQPKFISLVLAAILVSSSYCPCFAEDLPPVEPQLRTGCEFSEQALDSIGTQSVWFHIPWWLAGTWQRERTATWKSGERAVVKKDERIRKFGFQTDAKGGIWHYVRTPFKVVTHTPGSVNYFLIRKEEPIKISKTEATIRMIWTIWHVSEKTGRIVRVNQGDQVDTFRPMNEMALEATSYCQAYTEKGTPMGAWRASWTDHKIEKYAPTAEYCGQNLVELLSDYLKSTGKYNRVPNGSAVQSQSSNKQAETGESLE